MIENPVCPICRAETWDLLARKHYSLKPGYIEDDYHRVRREILFNVWFPGQQAISLESILCEACGFVCYRPRPETVDIDRKYTYLAEHDTAKKEFSQKKASDIKRSSELHTYLEPYLGDRKCSLLDYGGGNGRLLQVLLDKGHECSIVELVDETLPGITYIGNQIAHAVTVGNFDLVVCSHVLEHVVEPLATVLELSRTLRDDGYIYIEVPHELWREAPPKVEPVTHINFFSTDSLRTLLEEAGLTITSCEYRTFTRPNGLVGIAIKAIAQKLDTNAKNSVSLGGKELALSQINVGRFRRFLRLLRYPRLISNLFRSPTP